jgi:DNA repair protein RadD
MTHIQLRDYQEASIEGVYKFFEEKRGNPLIVLPTGTGKSVVVAEFVRGVFEMYGDSKIVMLTHVQELVEQNAKQFLNLWPGAPLGICCAGLKKKVTDTPVVFASIQSIFRKGLNLGAVDLILIDEAHLIPRKNKTMYQKFIADILIHSPHCKLIGLTATPYRMDSGLLYDGDDAMFDGVAYEMTISEAVAAGWICEPVPVSTKTKLDVEGVGKRGGEYIQSQLQKAVDIPETTRDAVAEIVAASEDRKSWLIFCSGVEHALHTRDALRLVGVTAETVTGDTPKAERAQILRDFKAGKIRALTNMSVLTTGFDAPEIDLIALLRPTMSPGLLVQMVGRGTRLAPGKENCLVLDFAKNFNRHGVLDEIQDNIKRPKKGAGDAVMKTCPQCHEVVYGGVRTCPFCGYEFPVNPEIQSQSSDDPILASQNVAKAFTVKDVVINHHMGASGKTSLKVTYVCDTVSASEWICFEHTGYPRRKAEAWWARRAPGTKIPATVNEAVSRGSELTKPLAIQAKREGKYWSPLAFQYPS